MRDLNKVVLIGRLTRDIELRYSNNGTCFGHFSIAVNRGRKTEGGGYADEASFFECDVFGKTAENLSTYLRKGKQVAVEGELEQKRWTKDGGNFQKIVVNVYSIQLLGGNHSAEAAGEAADASPYTLKGRPVPGIERFAGVYGDSPSLTEGFGGFGDNPSSAEGQRKFEDDIPF